jgi:leucyl/phenylalanyl-tRNA--protein transferase
MTLLSPAVLTTEMLLAAYGSGIFPMAVNDQGDIAWFSPDPRALIPLDERFHISHGLRRTLKKKTFQVTFDTCFEQIIRNCASAHGSTWISKDIIHGYTRLHEEGFAHSIEILRDGELVGGLYGVHLGSAFFGESMYHHVPDASKVALVALVDRLRHRQFILLDTQWMTPHLEQFGAYLVPKADYLALLTQAVRRETDF